MTRSAGLRRSGGEDGCPEGEPGLGAGPVRGQVQHRSALGSGDVVTVAISPYDLSKGRITYRGPLRQAPDAVESEA